MVVLPEPSLLLPKLSVWLDPTVSTVISGSLKSCVRDQVAKIVQQEQNRRF